jgi:hypothetical protein
VQFFLLKNRKIKFAGKLLTEKVSDTLFIIQAPVENVPLPVTLKCKEANFQLF